jgi:hypothetical protein
LTISDLDARVLRATDRRYERTPAQIGHVAGCAPGVARSCLRRLRLRYLVEEDGRRPARWLRSAQGDGLLEARAVSSTNVVRPLRSTTPDDR